MKNVYVAFASLNNRQNDYVGNIELTTLMLDDQSPMQDVFNIEVCQKYMKEIECSWAEVVVESNGVVVWDAADNFIIASDNVFKVYERIANIYKEGWES